MNSNIDIEELKDEIKAIDECAIEISKLRKRIGECDSNRITYQNRILNILGVKNNEFPVRIIIENTLYVFEFDGSFTKHKIDKIL